MIVDDCQEKLAAELRNKNQHMINYYYPSKGNHEWNSCRSEHSVTLSSFEQGIQLEIDNRTSYTGAI
jgi:S-formylglutathione hydrolase FrmB